MFHSAIIKKGNMNKGNNKDGNNTDGPVESGVRWKMIFIG
jgi:hypothetical protein